MKTEESSSERERPGRASVLDRLTRHRRVAAVGLVAALAVSIVAVSLYLSGSRPPLTGASIPPSAIPSPTTGPTSTPTTLPTSGAWGALAVAPFAPVAELVPTSRDASGVALDASFVLTSRTEEAAIDLVKRLTVSPRIALSAAAGADPHSVTIRPDKALTAGAVYRFRLEAPDGSLAGSWAFQAEQPLHVVATLPGDQFTDVPLHTGIEVTFDQDGVRDAGSYFSIEPAAPGRFEQHGRVLVFVPQALEPRTIYTVTVRRGVPLAGSDQVLEQDVRFQFETVATDAASGEGWLQFSRQVMEWETGSAPVIPLFISRPELAALPVDVYRFDTLGDFRAALDSVEAAPTWAQWAGSQGRVPTDGLTRVAHLDAVLEPIDSREGFDQRLFRLPRLQRGWYLVEATFEGRPYQFLLQVTDVTTYAAITSTRTVFWVNDLATKGPLAGAEVVLRDGTVLGRTDRDGLLVADSAAVLAGSPAHWDVFERTPRPAVVVRAPDGRTALVHLSESYGGCGGSLSFQSPADPFWHLLYLQRSLFRPTDVINVWGLVRTRESLAVPGDLELRLLETSQVGSPPIAVASLEPRESGAFAASIDLEEAPIGSYRLQLWSGEQRITDRWLTIGPIVKPAYRLELSTNRQVYIAGDPVAVTVAASFYEGTALPGVGISLEGFGAATATTGSDGTATVRQTAAVEADVDGWSWVSPWARPSEAEESEISGATTVLVFRSARTIDAEGVVAGGKLTVEGSVHAVDLARLERDLDAATRWDLDPRGAPSAGVSVTARVTELTWVTTQIGTHYDFIEKQVEPSYSYSERQRDLGTLEVITRADGSFAFLLPVAAGDHGYRIVLTAPDPQGRQTRLTIGATTDAYRAEPQRGAYLEQAQVPNGDLVTYALGDTARVTMRDEAGPLPEGGANRYLFVRAQRGFRDAGVQTSPTYSHRFGADDVPDTMIWSARFDGSVYELISYGATLSLDRSTRTLEVALATDAARYVPGGAVTLDVTTRRTDGTPVSATVTLGAVDEKLFALGAVEVIDPLGDLYARLPSGVLRTYASHRSDRFVVGCGSESGGRDDFRDEILFRQVTTDSSGRARVTFKLSDDLTSWYVTAAAVTGTPEAGFTSLLVPVGLSFFVDATLAPEYLAGERPVLRLRAFGDALRPGDEVRFEVASETLGMTPATVTGRAFEPVAIGLPTLSSGPQQITIAASSGSGPGALGDRLTRTFTVVETRLVRGQTEYAALGPGFRPTGGPGLTTFTFSDAGRGRFQPLLQELLWSGSARLDRSLAAEQARSLLAETFGEAAAAVAPPPTFSPERYQTGEGGIALLPYAGPDLELSAWVAFTAPERFNGAALRDYLSGVRASPATTRERAIIALAGLTASGEPLLRDVQAAAALPDLTIRERLWIALAAEAVGDDGTALAMERDLLAGHGQRLGPWVRLRVGESLDDTLEATALLAVVAAGLGDPLAAEADAYVASNPAKDLVFDLQRFAYAHRAIERTPSAPASFAYTVDGVRRVVQLGAGESFSLALTTSQRASLSLERLGGEVGVTMGWQVAFAPAGIQVDPALRIERAVSPAGVIPAEALVTVTLRVTFDRQAPRNACYQVTDFAPSGLAPTTFQPDPASGFVYPYSVVGQRVDFCADAARPLPLRYVARVVSPGTYTWEPGIVQSTVASESVALTPATTITIR